MPRKRFKKHAKVSDAVKTYVHRALSSEIETKNVILDNAPATIPDVGTLFVAVAPAQGDNIYERTGNVISPRRYECRVRLIATTPATIRMLLISTMQQATVTAPLIGDVLGGLGAGQVDAPLSGLNNTSSSNHDFRILHDSLHDLNVGAGLSKAFTIRLRPPTLPRKLHFNGNLATDAGKGFMYWIMAGSQPVAGNNCTAYLTEQLWYDDA